MCRLNGRLLARNVLNGLLGGLCSKRARPAQHVVRVLPAARDAANADVAVPGLVRQLRFSVLDGWAREARPTAVDVARAGAGGEDLEMEAGLAVPLGADGNPGVSAAEQGDTRAAVQPGSGDEGRQVRWAYRRTWPKAAGGQWAVAEVRIRWVVVQSGAREDGVVLCLPPGTVARAFVLALSHCTLAAL